MPLTNLDPVAPKVDCLFVASLERHHVVQHQGEEIGGVAQLWDFPLFEGERASFHIMKDSSDTLGNNRYSVTVTSVTVGG